MEPTKTSPDRKRRRVLVSAYACSPQWGSEPEVGWRWLLEVARLHEVSLLTHAYFREHLEPVLAERGLSVKVHYFQPYDFGWHPYHQLRSRLYYCWWQWSARSEVRSLLEKEHVDLIHHLTWGTLRFPCLLGGLGVPLVMGPLGGGESAPARLLQGVPWRLRLFDALRAVSLSWSRMDPVANLGPRRAKLILCRTRESLRRLPQSLRQRSLVVPDVGSPPLSLEGRMPTQPVPARLRLLFAGRLLVWKGAQLALGAVRRLLDAGHDVDIEIAGDGPMRAHLVAEIERLNLRGHAKLVGSLPRDELLARYAAFDVFLFPSLHDAGGTVVLEALSRGLPVVCLNLGGPPNFINPSCGAVVETLDRSRSQVEDALAQAVARALTEPGLLQRWTEGAARRAQELSWTHLVEHAYSHIHEALGWTQTMPPAETVGTTLQTHVG